MNATNRRRAAKVARELEKAEERVDRLRVELGQLNGLDFGNLVTFNRRSAFSYSDHDDEEIPQ